MTTAINIRAGDPNDGAHVVDDLIRLGVQPERLRLYGRRIPKPLGVRVVQWRPAATTLVPAALAGAAVAVLLGALVLGGVELVSTLSLAVLGAASGALWQRYQRERTLAPLGPQRDALRRGELVIVAEVDDTELAQLEAQLAERHPEVLLLGPDPAGSPPFP